MANLRFSPMTAFYPTADALLAADRNQLAETVLRHVKTYEGGGTVHQPVGGFNRGYYIQTMDGTIRGLGPLPTSPEYGAKQPQVSTRIQEAWHRLEREGAKMGQAKMGQTNFSSYFPILLSLLPLTGRK